jgi:hypothetical protein
MIKVTAANLQETLEIEEEEIVLSGPPQALTGTVLIKNKESQTVFIRELAFSTSGTELHTTQQRLPLLTSLQAGEVKVQQLLFQLPLHTPPGNYERKLMIGDKEKQVRLLVQPNIEIDINPTTLHFQSSTGGKTHQAEITITNSGNLPFRIPSNIKHTTMLDEDYLCRALSFAIREKGAEGFNPVMDELTRNIHREMADWVELRLEENGKIIDPGKSVQVHLSITLPDNVNSSRDYSGNIRIANKNIAYRINAFEDHSHAK